MAAFAAKVQNAESKGSVDGTLMKKCGSDSLNTPIRKLDGSWVLLRRVTSPLSKDGLGFRV